jgi:hypothetical protein
MLENFTKIVPDPESILLAHLLYYKNSSLAEVVEKLLHP